MRVQAVNIAGRLAILSDGRAVPITNLFDNCGDETDDPSEATSFVCGEGRMWFSDHVERFERVSTQ